MISLILIGVEYFSFGLLNFHHRWHYSISLPAIVAGDSLVHLSSPVLCACCFTLGRINQKMRFVCGFFTPLSFCFLWKPLHRSCYQDYFLLVCEICLSSVLQATTKRWNSDGLGNASLYLHPLFTWLALPKHNADLPLPIRRNLCCYTFSIPSWYQL